MSLMLLQRGRDMKTIVACLVLLLCVTSVHAAEKKSKYKSSTKMDRSEIIKPIQPFEWGDNVVDAVRKICAMQPVPAVKSFGTRNINCNEQLELDVTATEPLYIFGAEEDVSLLNYKGVGIQVGTGYQVKYSPIIIRQVEYEVTLQFNSLSEGYGAFLYDRHKDKMPWILQKGSRIYLPVVLISLRLTPISVKGQVDFKYVTADIENRHRMSFVKEIAGDKKVFHKNGTWLHIYDDGDMFFDGETLLKNSLTKYENYIGSGSLK